MGADEAVTAGFAGGEPELEPEGRVCAKMKRAARLKAEIIIRRKIVTKVDRCILSLRFAELRALRRIASKRPLYNAGWGLQTTH
jgi:hypothetical protein